MQVISSALPTTTSTRHIQECYTWFGTSNIGCIPSRAIPRPFKDFSAVIGSNGVGKSNLMDSISFCLGVRSTQLRSNQLRDLIYRAGTRHGTGTAQTEQEEDPEEQAASGRDGEQPADRAWVLAVYVDRKGKEWKFQRT